MSVASILPARCSSTLAAKAMSANSARTRWSHIATAAAFVGATAAVALSSRDAQAQEVVSSTAKGVVGGAILGGEVVMITEAIIGVKPTWAYLLGGGVGAVGGGIAGYFIEQSSTDGVVPSYMLAGGLILSIPTLVLTLNATRYMPTETAREDQAPVNAPPADMGTPGGSAVSPATASPSTGAPAAAPATPAPAAAPPAAPPPTSMFNIRDGAFRLSVPVPEVRQVFSMAERRQLNMKQETELRFPVLHVAF